MPQLCDTYKRAVSNDNTPKILLALAGGGSHGAFTAGALEALEEEGILDHVRAVTGTSAGALNAACVAAGIHDKQNAPQSKAITGYLRHVWDGVAHRGDSLRPIKNLYRAFSSARWPNLPEKYKRDMALASHTSSFYGMKTQSGYLRDLIDETIRDWAKVRKSPVKTVVNAAKTVRGKDGNPVLKNQNFSGKDLGPNAVAASGCLIGTHRKGRTDYKDGAHVKNPPIARILPANQYTDILAIMLAPEPDSLHPTHEDHIIPNDDLVREEAYAHLAHEVKKGQHHVHVIKLMLPDWIDDTSKLNFDRKWIDTLRESGREAARLWIKAHKNDLGKRSTYHPNIAPEPGQSNTALPECSEVA